MHIYCTMPIKIMHIYCTMPIKIMDIYCTMPIKIMHIYCTMPIKIMPIYCSIPIKIICFTGAYTVGAPKKMYEYVERFDQKANQFLLLRMLNKIFV